MNEPSAKPAPTLARYAGAEPPAPQWFRDAVDTPHERSRVEVEGADIEWLGWGERGRPGLLFLHGNGAHADWWRFTAPFFAQTHRVAALSWSGMGNSDHRPAYTMELFVAEILAVAQAAGLLDHGPFTVVGHSFGGFPMMALASRPDAPLKQAIILDTPFDQEQRRRPRDTGGDARPHHVYPTMAEALARFRWAPPQPTTNDYIADFIARLSLKPVEGGFTWKFDPFLWSDFERRDSSDPLRSPHCPVALLWGERSELVNAGLVADMIGRLPASTRLVPIPEAYHHVMADQPLALLTALRGLFA
ncbi:alpha/beta hydrolase [Sandaracinobacter sp. RS1-74]|uniref:alpha/beta fold hydrolase n=1 Tax=Sandaracinobacteroides sayramensis TaxID=2913411 RepID=UPI001EDA1DC5|nr:alpha/beta hydrolase [Sandaracinobacteroides sayramensis]MCG2839458.1 alpha/beta hydrolase [Sandaracinobacteroides sayramensis]